MAAWFRYCALMLMLGMTSLHQITMTAAGPVAGRHGQHATKSQGKTEPWQYLYRGLLSQIGQTERRLGMMKQSGRFPSKGSWRVPGTVDNKTERGEKIRLFWSFVFMG